MYRFLLRPRWIAFHLLVLLAIVVMVNLGLWQWHRLQDRREFNAEVRERSAQPIEAYERLVTAGTVPDDVEWRAVTVTGEYLADEQVLIVNRSQEGTAGVDVVTPIALADGSLLLVNRGFVPLSQTVPPPPAGAVTVDGRLHVSQVRRLGQLSDGDGERTEFQRIDIERIAQQLPRAVAPVYLDLRVSNPDQGVPPYPVPDPELSEGPHLSYMVQWFIFSIAVAVGWVLAVRRSVSTRRRAAVALSAAGPSASPDSPMPDDDEPTTAPSGTRPPSPG